MRKIIFKSLKLTNFRCHDEMDFDFEENRFSVIVGDNGKGKSSIFEGLFWAIYDETTNGRTGDSIVRHRAGKNCSSILEFDILDGDKKDSYKIENYRKHKDHKNSKFIYKNDEKQLGEDPSRKEMISYLENIILPKKIFLNCLLFSQFIKESFVDLTHSGQKEILDSLLSLESYDDYQKKISLNINLVKSELNIHDNNINSINEKISDYKNLIKNELEQLKEIKNTEDNKVENISNEIELLDAQSLLKKSTELSEKLEKETNEINNLISKIDSLRMKLEENLENVSKQKQDIADRYKDKKSVETIEIKNKYNEKINELKEIISNLKNEIQINKTKYEEKKSSLLLKQNDIIKEKLSHINNKIEEQNEIKTNLFLEKNELKSSYVEKTKENNNILEDILKYENSFKDEKTICSSCGQEIKDEDKIKEYKNILKTLRNDNKKLDEEIKQIKTKGENINNKIKNLEESINSLKEELEKEEESIKEKIKKEFSEFSDIINKEVTKIKEQITTNEQDLENITNLIDSKIEENNKLLTEKYEKEIQKIKEFDDTKINHDIEILESKRKNHTENIISVNNNLKNIQENLNNIELLKVRIKEIKENLKATLSRGQESVNSKKELCKNSEQEIFKIESLKKDNLEKIEVLNFWKSAFGDNGIRAILLDEALPILNKKARELSSYVEKISVSFDSQKQLSSGKQKDAFSINAVQTDNLSGFSDFSAGEKRIANIIVLLCLRELLEVMNNTKINILLLDEILDSLDPKNSLDAVEIMKIISSDYCVVLISHTLRDWIECDEYIKL